MEPGGVMTYATLVAGMIYLLVGGDLLVRGAVALARRARIPPAVVAATIIALGTSIPELVVALRASLTGYPGLVLGNVVGSNTANVLLVGGMTALLFRMPPGEGPLRRDTILMLLASLLLLAACLRLEMDLWVGLGLVMALALFWAITARGAVREYRAAAPATIEFVLGLPSRIPMILLFIFAGGLGLPLGAKLMVDSSVEIATVFGLSATVVGLTIVAFSTSLPELATTLVAGYQGRPGVAVGAILGSNVFNALGIMGAAALASPIPIAVPPDFVRLDLPVMLAASGILAAFVLLRRPLGRVTGGIFVAGYVLYMTAVLGLG